MDSEKWSDLGPDARVQISQQKDYRQTRLKRSMSLAVVLISLLFINAGYNPPSPNYPSIFAPQPPALGIRNVSLVSTTPSPSYQYPYIPSFRTSADGRVAVSVKELTGGKINFYLFVPEAINQNTTPFPLTGGTTAPRILPVSAAVQLSDSVLQLPGGYTAQHHTICDPTVQDLDNPPPNPNPWACGADDCYTFWIISTAANPSNPSTSPPMLNSVQVTVDVASPKQTGAQIVSVQVVKNTTPTYQTLPIINTNTQQLNLLEPMITTDGHLLVGRIQQSTLTWTNNALQQISGIYNIVYSAGTKSDSPCDIGQWSSLYPVAHAYFDSNVHNRYGFADYQLRDSENNFIPEQADIEGSYPWIDRMGRNLFFTHVSAMLFNSDSSSPTGVRARYSDGCATTTNCDPDPCTYIGSNSPCGTQPSQAVAIGAMEEPDSTRGLTVAGRWTHGKMVQLDGLVNNIDYGLHVADPDQRILTLYSSGNPARFGSGRYNAAFVGEPTDYAENTTITDSFENIFNYVATLKPITLREVVWQLNMGKGGDEIAFDDYINPKALIVSDMTASTSWTQYQYPGSNNNLTKTPPFPTYADGFTASGGFNSQIHLQNSATTDASQWQIPAFGVVKGSTGNLTGMTARIEPAALGGIKGKGFWLQDGNYVSYTIPSPQVQSVMQTPWFISLFADSRCCTASGDLTPRRILTFPDQSYVNIVGSSYLQIGYFANGVLVPINKQLPTALNLPIPSGWWHMALQVVPNTQNNGQTDTVNVYINGYLWQTFQTNAPIFQILPPPPATCPLAGCQLTLGGDPVTTDKVTGFTGWIDEFKVIAQNVDYETVCNHAHGTIAGSNTQFTNSYPDSGTTSETHQINQQTNQNLLYYGCVTSYLSDTSATYLPAFGVTTGNLPSGSTSMRDLLHFPNAPHYYQDRPDSTKNQFCTSCHVDFPAQFSATLQTSALTAGTVPMSTDRRRQPMSPQRLVYGHVPSGYFNHTEPGSDMSSLPAIPLDNWVFP